MALEQKGFLPCRAPYWERRIKDEWANHNRHCLSLCFLTAEAKRRLARGEWSRLFRSYDMPSSKREGEMRVRIWHVFGELFTLPNAAQSSPWSYASPQLETSGGARYAVLR